MFRLKSDDGEAHDDISTLLKKIRGAHTPEDKSTGFAPSPEKKSGPDESEPVGQVIFLHLYKNLA